MRFKFGRHGKSNLRQVETQGGGAKMNVAPPNTSPHVVEPHPHRGAGTNNLPRARDAAANGMSAQASGGTPSLQTAAPAVSGPQRSDDKIGRAHV